MQKPQFAMRKLLALIATGSKAIAKAAKVIVGLHKLPQRLFYPDHVPQQ
jgi:hypothetical protein